MLLGPRSLAAWPASSSGAGRGLSRSTLPLERLDVAGKAVLVHTGWDRRWRTAAYQENHPFLTAVAARQLAERGARLVGIDSHNIDDTRTRSRPVHTILLQAGVLICEHMTNLGALPDGGFAFTAVPPKIVGMGTFPVAPSTRRAEMLRRLALCLAAGVAGRGCRAGRADRPLFTTIWRASISRGGCWW